MKKQKKVLFGLLLILFSVHTWGTVNLKWTSAGISMSPESPATGNSVTFEAVLRCKFEPADNVKVICRMDGAIIWTHVYSHLTAGDTKTVSVTWTADTGSHRIKFKADPDNTIQETDETDNAIVKDFSVSFRISDKIPQRPDSKTLAESLKNLPDLTANLTTSPMRPSNVFDTVFNIRVDNRGEGGSREAHLRTWIERQEGGKLIEHIFPIPAIKAGAKENIRYQYRFSSQQLGQYVFKAQLDINNRVLEKNEDNNSGELDFSVEEARPDLTASNLSVMQRNRVGFSFPVWGKVKNIGKTRAGPFTIFMIGSGDKKRTKNVSYLMPGQEVEFEFNFKYWTKGTRRFKLVVDDNAAVDEANEGNNEFHISTKIILNLPLPRM